MTVEHDGERVRAEAPGIEVADRLVERNGVPGLVIRTWTIPERWADAHAMDTAVALLDRAGNVTTHAERLPFWPFTREMLDADLLAAGLHPAMSTWAPDADRYLLPDVVLSRGRFLDGETVAVLPRRVEIVATDGAALVRAVTR